MINVYYTLYTSSSVFSGNELFNFYNAELFDSIKDISNISRRIEKTAVYSLLAYAFSKCTLPDVFPLNIKYSAQGKPYADNSSIRFSISHTENACACVISTNECGIDIENLSDFNFSVAKRFFLPDELELIFTSNEPKKEFYKIWTRKESYIKKTGDGFSRPLSSFSVICDDYFHTSYIDDNLCLSVCSALAQNIMPYFVPSDKLIEWLAVHGNE